MNDLRQTAKSQEAPPYPKQLYGSTAAIKPAAKILHVGLLSNPFSGGNRNGLGVVREILASQPHAIHREVRAPTQVASALADFARQGVDVIAVNGGDGTIQSVLTALFNHRPFEKVPLLALLRSGTDSIISRKLGIRGSREKGLWRLLNWARTRNREDVVLEHPIMRVQIMPDQDPFYGMIFGTALAYQGIRYRHHRIHSMRLTGELAPGLTVARFLLAIARGNKDYTTPVPITIGLDQNPPTKQNFLLVVITTLDRLFVGLRPFWGTENGPLHFTAIGARPRHLLRVLPFLGRGRKCRHGTPENGYFSHNVHTVRLTFNSGFTLDGELYSPDPRGEPLEVKYGGQVSFIVF